MTDILKQQLIIIKYFNSWLIVIISYVYLQIKFVYL